MKVAIYKNDFGVVSILYTDRDMSGTEGYIVLDEKDLPSAPQELWDIVDGKLIVKQPPKIPLDEIKAKKKAEINAAKTTAEYANIAYAGYEIQADADSQAKLTSAVLLCQAAGLKKYTWWTADNRQVDFTIAELLGLGMAIATRSAELVAKGRNIKDAVNAATSPQEIENIKWEK